jgi:branched-chain amino acid transport system permease protein
MKLKRYNPVFILIILAAVIPVMTSIFGVNFYLTQLTMSAYYILVALGLCLLMGYAGQISLGQAGFFAIGGYTSAILTTINLSQFSGSGLVQLFQSAGLILAGTSLYGDKILYLSPCVGFIAAILLSAGIAVLIGIPVLKLKGHYLAMATLGFGVIIEKVARGTKLFGGADGITNVPAFSLFPGIRVSGDSQDRIMNYLIAWAIVVISMVLIVNLINSRTGRALRALHGSEEAADSMGINTARYKLLIFVIGAVFASAAGIFMTHFNGSIGPGEAAVIKSVRYVAIVAVGGMANIWGTLTIGIILNFLSLRGTFGSYDDAVFGTILILVMLFSPDGIIRSGFFKDNLKFLKNNKSKKDEPSSD